MLLACSFSHCFSERNRIKPRIVSLFSVKTLNPAEYEIFLSQFFFFSLLYIYIYILGKTELKDISKRVLFGIEVLVEQSSSTSQSFIVAPFVRLVFGALGPVPQIINNYRAGNQYRPKQQWKDLRYLNKLDRTGDCLLYAIFKLLVIFTGEKRVEIGGNAFLTYVYLINDRFFCFLDIRQKIIEKNLAAVCQITKKKNTCERQNVFNLSGILCNWSVL